MDGEGGGEEQVGATRRVARTRARHRLAPEFALPWLYPRLVWGGIWGLLLLLPLLKGRPVERGVLFSLAPTAYVLLVVFPGMGKGALGLGFGTLTPLLVTVLNFGWGVVAALWYRACAR